MIDVSSLDSVLGVMLKERLRFLSVTEGSSRISLKLADKYFSVGELGPEIIVRSHAIGRFSSAHPRQTNLKVSTGAQVEPATIVGFLETGTILLPVRAGCSGTVKQLHVQDGALLGYGEPIATIQAES